MRVPKDASTPAVHIICDIDGAALIPPGTTIEEYSSMHDVPYALRSSSTTYCLYHGCMLYMDTWLAAKTG